MAAEFVSEAGWRYENSDHFSGNSGASGGRGRGARKFANQERFGNRGGSFNSQPSFSSFSGGRFENGSSNFGNSDFGSQSTGGGFSSQSFNRAPENEFSDQFDNNDKADTSGDYTEETFSVETSLIPRIIGKKGATIQQLQLDFGCKIDVDRNSQSDSHTKVTLKGDHAKLINLKANLGQRFGGPFTSHQSASSSFGNEGWDRSDKGPGFGSSSSGGFGFQSFGRGPDNQSNGLFRASNEVTSASATVDGKYLEETFSLENALIPRLIGKRGAVIQQLQNDFECKIDIDKESTSTTHTDVTLKGDESKLKRLKERLGERYGAPFSSQSTGGPSITNHTAGFGDNSSCGGNFGSQTFGRTPENEFHDNFSDVKNTVLKGSENGSGNYVEETFSVENDLIPRIIGKRGATVQKLQADFDCKIDVVKESKTEAHTDITLKGNQDKLMQLKIRLEQRFGGNFGTDSSDVVANSGGNFDNRNSFQSHEHQANQSTFGGNSHVDSNFQHGSTGGFSRSAGGFDSQQSRTSFNEFADDHKMNVNSTFNENSARKCNQFNNGTLNNDCNENFSSGFGNQGFGNGSFSSHSRDNDQSRGFDGNTQQHASKSSNFNQSGFDRRSDNNFSGKNARNDEDFSVFSSRSNRSQQSSFGGFSNSQKSQNQSNQG